MIEIGIRFKKKRRHLEKCVFNPVCLKICHEGWFPFEKGLVFMAFFVGQPEILLQILQKEEIK